MISSVLNVIAKIIGFVLAFVEFEGSLYMGGGFDMVGNKPSLNIARWTPNRTGIPKTITPIAFAVFPNPFRASTTLQYELDAPGLVSLAAFDVQGRRVATIFEGHKDTGQWSHRWRGTDRYGSLLPAGVYYLELTVDRKKKQVRKLILLP